MKSKKLILTLFVLMVIVQLYVPAQMIFSKEDVLKTGKEFKFKIRPVDPNDPFRGKYITLFFEENSFTLDTTVEWRYKDQFYVTVVEDSVGYAQIINLTNDQPEGTMDYFKASYYGSSYSNGETTVNIKYPFEKYYMEESKAYEAEVAVREVRSDSTQIAYALVAVKDGDSVLKDVLVNGVPIKEVVLHRRENQEE